MQYIYEKFVQTEFDEKNRLKTIDFSYPKNFNFAFDVLDALAEKVPNKTAMLWVSNDGEEKKFTYSDMSEYSSMTANYFKSMGIKKGDRVLLILKRHYQFWFSILALHKIGAIAIPATDQLMKKDIVYRCELSGASAIICTAQGDICDKIDSAIEDIPTVKFLSRANAHDEKEGWDNFDKGIAGQSKTFIRASGDEDNLSEDTMLMFFTSGTTGYPKIACHSFTYPIGHIVTAKWWHDTDPHGIHFTISDTGWGKALWGKLYGQWLCESCVFVYDFDKFHADKILNMFSKYNITSFCAPPTMYRFFIKEELEKFDLSCLKHATIAGEALNPEVFSQFFNATGLKLMEGFGQTETTLSIANLLGTEPKPGSMGKPNPQYTVILLDSEGHGVERGEVGEICIDTSKQIPPGIFTGYYNEPEKTKEVWYDGYYHSGDMAWQDEEGYFWYVGRTDDLIKSSGYRIGPFEIESVIMELPFVLECAVTGVPDPIRGQAVKASIVLTKGVIGTEEMKKEIQDYVKKHTAPYKYPRVIEFLSDLPKTISGKIRRTELRKDEK